MKAIEAAVTSRLQAQRGQEAAVALWKTIWAAYENSGIEGAQEHLDGLRQLPVDDNRAAEENEP